MSTSTHFNARIVIEKVTKTEQLRNSGSTQKSEREVTELLSVNLKDGSLDQLVERVATHVGLTKDF